MSNFVTISNPRRAHRRCLTAIRFLWICTTACFLFTFPILASTADLFGIGLARGDFNNDGYEDLVVGASGRDSGGGADAGEVLEIA